MIQNSANERTTKGYYQTNTRLRSKHPTDRNADRNQFFYHLQVQGPNKSPSVTQKTSRKQDKTRIFSEKNKGAPTPIRQSPLNL